MTASPETVAYRHKVAAESRQRLTEAVAACGEGARGYGRWVVRDNLGIEPERVTYCAWRNDGRGWQPQPPECTSRERIERDVVQMTTLCGIKYEARAIRIGDLVFYPFRWDVNFDAIELYNPKTPEQLEAAERARVARLEAANRARDEEREQAAAEARGEDRQLALGFGPPGDGTP